MIKKIFLIFILALGLCLGTAVLAQETTVGETDAQKDEIINAVDLEIFEPQILPSSTFYFLKDWSRLVMSAFAFNPAKRLELKLSHLSERMLEAQKMAEENLDEKTAGKIVEAIEKYQTDLEKIQTTASLRQEDLKKDEETQKFLDKFVAFQLKHQTILDKLEKQLPERAFQRVRAAREESIKHFGEVMKKLENRAEFRERLKKILKDEGSELNAFKQALGLQKLGTNLPDDLKIALDEAKEERLEKFKEKIKNIPNAIRKEKLGNYIENLSSDELEKVEVLESMDAANMPALARQHLLEVREKQFQRIKEKIQGLEPEERREVLRKYENSDAVQLRVLEKIKQKVGEKNIPKFQEIFNKGIENLQERLNAAEDPETIEHLKTQIEKRQEVRVKIIQKQSDILRRAEERKKEMLKNNER